MGRFSEATESAKIVLLCIFAAVVYGILHDQITARICIEYFTVFHPPMFATQSPTLQGLGWGIIATWWAGAIVGILLRTAARSGPRNKMTVQQLFPFVVRLMIAMAFCAVVSGAIGYLWGTVPLDVAEILPLGLQRRFLFDWWTHTASYASGFIGGLILCIVIWIKRHRGARPAIAS